MRHGRLRGMRRRPYASHTSPALRSAIGFAVLLTNSTSSEPRAWNRRVAAGRVCANHGDLAASTERAYKYDGADFATFCRRHGLEALPAAPQALALYLKSLRTTKSHSPTGFRCGTPGLSVSTLRRRSAAIASKCSDARSSRLKIRLPHAGWIPL